jgi:peptide/nickel transport system substrate-binding protein
MSHPPQKLFLIFILFLLFLSCSSREDDSATLARKNGKPAYGGQLTIGVVGDLDTFNPLFSQSALGNEVIHLTLLGLADLNDKGEFVPELAESWEQSPDFLKLTYHLRKNARWSDGKPVSAYDVKFTFEALMDTMTGSPRSGYID